MHLPTAEQFDVFIRPRWQGQPAPGYSRVKVTIVNDRPSLDFIHTAFLRIVKELLEERGYVKDGEEKCLTVTDILTFAMQKYAV